MVPLDAEITYAGLVRKQDILAAELLTGYREAEKDVKLTEAESLLTVSGRDVCTSVVKRAEEDAGTIIVRVFNASGTATTAAIAFDRRIKKAGLVNLNEEPIEGEIEVKDSTVSTALAPWKIVTVAVAV